ncbi:hypothetical protein [Halomontanus rarus]|uniref:hypothetical protein n=1 Tax=Halomontanus rarus TaxID=3034020 RepID=UPI00307BBE5D
MHRSTGPIAGTPEAHTTDGSDLEVPDETPAHTCPNCGESAFQTIVRGPADRVFDPCGCRIPHVDR